MKIRLLFFLMTSVLHLNAGTVSTTPAADNKTIIIGKGRQVTFTASAGGTVTATLSAPGAAITGSGSSQTATFPDEGMDVDCTFTVTHTVEGDEGPITCEDGKAFNFRVIVPKITLALSGSQPHVHNSAEWSQSPDNKVAVSVSVTPSDILDEIAQDITFKIKEATPDTSDKGSVDQENFSKENAEILYFSKTEESHNKYINDPVLQMQSVKIIAAYNGIDQSDAAEIVAESIFKYHKSKNDPNQAILEVAKKYSISGVNATYDPSLLAYGGMSPAGSMFIGPSGMANENILASTLIHEQVHLNQGVSVRTQAALGKGYYENNTINALTKPYIAVWAYAELEAYHTERLNFSRSGLDAGGQSEVLSSITAFENILIEIGYEP